MKSVIEPSGLDAVTIPIISELSRGTSSSVIVFAKSGNIVTARIGTLRANSTVGIFIDQGVIPIGFRPAYETSITIANINKRATPESQEMISIAFLTNGNIQYYNFQSSTDNINGFPTNAVSYIASGA